MSFTLARVAGVLVVPSTLLGLAVLGGLTALWLGRPRLGRALVTVVVVVAVLPLVLPVAETLARPLEERYAVPEPMPARADGIVVLGGAGIPHVTDARDQVALGEAAERMTEAVRLAHLYPEARVVFTGGSGGLRSEPSTEADVARRFFAEQGLDPARLTVEDRSRDTYENAVFTLALVVPEPGSTWLLVTSALHLPRAVAVFEAAGWPVVPVPVAYRTPMRRTSWVAAWADLDHVVREWVATGAYRLLGRVDP